MVNRTAVVLVALALASPVQAQRWSDGQRGIGRAIPSQQDTTRVSREALFVRRAVRSSLTAMATAVPMVLWATANDATVGEGFLTAGALAYVGAATYGAVKMKSSNCRTGTRLWRAFGGALAGMSTAALLSSIADETYYEHGHYLEDRGRITAASFVLGVPIGAAAALYNCR